MKFVERTTPVVPAVVRGSLFSPVARRFTAGLLGLCLAAGVLGAAEDEKEEAKKPSGPPVPKTKKNDLKPIPLAEKPAWSHSPYEDGDCSICHQDKDPQKPGPIKGAVNQLCLDCHEDYVKVLARKSSHVAAKESCVSCHNPHNSKFTKLLVEEANTLCLSCHENIKKSVLDAKVKHDAITMDGKCANCHNPHGANVEHLLAKPAFDLCMNCHAKDGVKDQDGKLLTNFKTLLEQNPIKHGPVDSKDCSACHTAHGGDLYRLLIGEYPPDFYSPYDPKMYAFCYECHEASILESPKTTKLTQFRNGDQNLHYLHVNKAERGRTCRACHEVHASKQKHQIRDAVPYGAKGWMLKVGYTKTDFGGTCAKTCHATKSYTNAAPATVSAPK